VEEVASDMDNSGINKFPEDAASGGAPVAGWPRRMFLCGRTGRVAHSDGPFYFRCYAGWATLKLKPNLSHHPHASRLWGEGIKC
jgi:hypothetical protein